MSGSEETICGQTVGYSYIHFWKWLVLRYDVMPVSSRFKVFYLEWYRYNATQMQTTKYRPIYTSNENKRAKSKPHLLIYSFLFFKLLLLGFGLDFEFGLELA